ncbi:MAG: PKD domain-containing protein [Acidimicrobiales bacterium]
MQDATNMSGRGDERMARGHVVRESRDPRELIGGAMVVVGLVFFVIIFIVLFPVLTNPAGAYDRWFPNDGEETVASGSEAPVVERIVAGPTAQFRWEVVDVDGIEPAPNRVRLTSEAVAGDAAITAVRWGLGNGATATGPSIEYDYPAPGSYSIALLVEDANGRIDEVRGVVAVDELRAVLGSSGRVDATSSGEFSLDNLGDGISDSLEGAVGDVGDDITNTIDSAFGSIGSTFRGAVVVVLFTLSALAATMVAWRTARIGVMLMSGERDVRSSARRRSYDDEEDIPGRRGLEVV